MVPRAVLMKSGLVLINTDRQNISKPAVLVNTARQVNAAHSKTTVNVVISMSYLSKITHLTVKRPIHKSTTFKNGNINQRVNTVRDINFNTARPKVVANVVNGNNLNAVKASACWVWKPKTKVLDHVSKHNSASITLKKFDYIDAQGIPKVNTAGSKLIAARHILTTVGAKLMLLGITYYCQLKVNAARHNLLLLDGKKIIITESSIRRDFQLTDEEGVDCLLNSTIFEQLALIGKPKRKDTQVPDPTDPTESVIDEAVYKELGDSLVRAATTASSLEAEQDSGNITKTQYKATPNESISQRTDSGGGPMCQETIRDTSAQTRFESVSKHSNDLLLARGNTLQSDEDRRKLDELMALCTTLQNRVFDLEKTKTTQQIEIDSLKKRVKKLEKKNMSRNHKLKRLYKVGLTARVESSGDEESLGDDASKQGRIEAIDADEKITLVNVHDDADKEMFDVNVLDGEEVFVTRQNENVVKEVVDAAQVSTAATTATITTEEITLSQALEALKTSKPKVKGIVFQKPGESTTTTTISSKQSHEKGKGIMIEELVKSKKKDQIRLDEEAALYLQDEFDEEARLTREKAVKEQEANIALIEE
uniref:Uncharacterized protein n=1 Tax=Tanacetum cinerariifolium TaxID=118510 RepID=A0A6L2K438_TANCI|nr:hypothetical protein [Tanacetum cinerariifolium]